MFRAEKKVLVFIEKNILWFFLIGIFSIGTLMRLKLVPFESGDYLYYYKPWYDKIKDLGGLMSLKEQIVDYGVPYQLFVLLMTKLPMNSLTAYKFVSSIFDILLAATSSLIVFNITASKKKSVASFAAIWCSPIIMLNSCAWSQCDSIYTSFILLSIYSIVSEKKPFWTYIYLGLAFSFKPQTFFILPFILLVYVIRKNHSILYFLIIPLVIVITSIPGIIAGRKISDVLLTFFEQAKNHGVLALNYPGFICILDKHVNVPLVNSGISFDIFSDWLILFTIAILLCGACYLWNKKEYINKTVLLIIALLSIYTCVMFMPSMHERYGYGIDILSILIAVLLPETILHALIINILSLIQYGVYLGGFSEISIQILAIVNMYEYIRYITILYNKLLPYNSYQRHDQSSFSFSCLSREK